MPRPVCEASSTNLDLLNAQTIWRMLDVDVRQPLSGIQVLAEVDSTNAYLLRKTAFRKSGGQVCLAEAQTAGRGRPGKTWVSPRSANLYMSLAWRLNKAPATAARLSLFVGIALADVLTALGIEGVALKWPNDIMWQDRKLGGVLIEAANGFVVIGVGLNVRMPQFAAEKINQPWTDLATILRDVPSRNRLAASLLNAIIPTLDSFARETGQSLPAAWRRYDLLYRKEIVLESSGGTQYGTGAGVDGQGRLLLQVDDQVLAFSSGEARVKREQDKPTEALN